MRTTGQVPQTANPDSGIGAMVLSMFDVRNNLSRRVARDARGTWGGLVSSISGPRSVRLGEATSLSIPVLEYDCIPEGSKAFLALAS